MGVAVLKGELKTSFTEEVTFEQSWKDSRRYLWRYQGRSTPSTEHGQHDSLTAGVGQVSRGTARWPDTLEMG